MGDVVVLMRVEPDEEGFPALPEWAARAAGLREDQRRLVVLEDGRVVLAHLAPEAVPVPMRRPEPPEPAA